MAEARTSYDTVAVSYEETASHALAEKLRDQAALGMFVDLAGQAAPVI